MNASHSSGARSGRAALLLAAGWYLLFIVYGSLMPLEFQALTLEAAWRELLGPVSVINFDSPDDWISNALLMMPLAFLLSAAYSPAGDAAAMRLPGALALIAVCAVVAVGVEVAQLFVPGRTASINDVIAQLVGALLGVSVWRYWGSALERLWDESMRGGAGGIRAAGILYALAYLTLSLFPFDLILSTHGLLQKLDSGAYGFLIAPMACGQRSGCLPKLVAEIAVAMPLGVLLSIVMGGSAQHPYRRAALWGLALGATIEVAQLFIASGISQGASVLTRTAALVLGVAAHRSVGSDAVRAMQPHLRAIGVLSVAPYLLAAMWYSGWFGARWGGLAFASSSLEKVDWRPFYYHYFTTETVAFVSSVATAAMFVPIGVLCWVWEFTGRRSPRRSAVARPATMAASLAVVLEAGKLFVLGKHPDPTNILIAALAATGAYLVARRLFNGLPVVERVQGDSDTQDRNSPPPIRRRRQMAAWAAAALLLGTAGVAVASYPLHGPWLSIGLAGYALVIWRYPAVLLPATVALFPLLDLTPWTGWLMLNEFDLLMLVTLGVGVIRVTAGPGQSEFDGPFGFLAGMVALSYLVSLGIGLWPLEPWDANAFSTYYSHYNALRVAKGAVWALALPPLVAASTKPGVDIRQPFALGAVVGLIGTIAVIVWERVAFTGLFNFSHDYRVTGPFSALHVGGASVEGYLVAMLPFLVYAIAVVRNSAMRLGGVLLFAGGIYAVMVTYSRAGMVALVIGILLTCAAFVFRALRDSSNRMRRAAPGIVFAVIAASVAVPVVYGSFARDRLAHAGADLQIRFSYWSNALAIMDDGWRASLFGMGLGRFPETFFWRSTVGAKPGTFRYESEGGNVFLRLGWGSPLFINQIVALKPHTSYVLSLDVRSSESKPGELGVPICEKRVHGSFACATPQFRLSDAANTWQHHEVAFSSDGVGAGRWFSRRPVTLALYSPAGILDVDNVHLIGEDGLDLVANGGFDRGSDRWLFTVDDNLPWHVENFWVHVYFEEGWLGLLSVTLLTMSALFVAFRGLWRGDLFAGMVAASITGFLAVGVFNSPNDNPQLMFLLLLLCWVSFRAKAVATCRCLTAGAR